MRTRRYQIFLSLRISFRSMNWSKHRCNFFTAWQTFQQTLNFYRERDGTCKTGKVKFHRVRIDPAEETNNYLIMWFSERRGCFIVGFLTESILKQRVCFTKVQGSVIITITHKYSRI